MRKISLSVVFIIITASLFAGCSSSLEDKSALIGEWRITGLENFYTGEEYDYSDEIYIFRENGTGMEIFKPSDYNEELSYISWKINSDSTTLSIKHSEEYIYVFTIAIISDDIFECSYYYENDPDTYYLATYEKMDEGSSDYVGCWQYTEYYEGEEYYDTEYYYLYLYPDGTMKDVYYEVQDQISDYGTWEINDDYLRLTFDGYETTQFDTSVKNNKMSLYETSEGGDKITYVYKRYYGQITNTPPATYPQSTGEAINEFFASIFKKVTKSISD